MAQLGDYYPAPTTTKIVVHDSLVEALQAMEIIP